MVTVSVVDAKASLSELLDKVESGEQVVITRHGRPVAHLSGVSRPKRPVARIGSSARLQVSLSWLGRFF